MYSKHKKICIGERFGKLTVTKCLGSNGKKKIEWECVCDCGKTVVHTTSALNCGKIHSCGCGLIEMYKKAKKNDPKDKKLYSRWLSIKDRCRNPKNAQYKNYGGRGITICPEWENDFYAFRDWAFLNGYDESLSIDRIDNDKGYSPDNCRWVDSKIQGNNRRTNHCVTIDGITKTIMQWSEIYGIKYDTINRRIRDGWSEQDAITKPIIPLGERHSYKRT